MVPRAGEENILLIIFNPLLEDFTDTEDNDLIPAEGTIAPHNTPNPENGGGNTPNPDYGRGNTPEPDNGIQNEKPNNGEGSSQNPNNGEGSSQNS